MRLSTVYEKSDPPGRLGSHAEAGRGMDGTRLGVSAALGIQINNGFWISFTV